MLVKSIFREASEPLSRDAEPGPASSPGAGRALSQLAQRERRGEVLSMQEALDFASAFLDEAIPLASVVVLHERSPYPLVWSAATTGEASLDHARERAEASHAQRASFDPDDPASAWAPEPPGSPAPRAITLPLGLPPLGVLRIEAASPLGPSELAFLHHAALLVSLALDRCAEEDELREAPPSSRPS